MSLEIVKKLKPCEFKYDEEIIRDGGKKHFGFIAQDLEEEFPIDEYAVVHEGAGGYKMVNYIQFIALLTKAIQELSGKVDKLEESVGGCDK